MENKVTLVQNLDWWFTVFFRHFQQDTHVFYTHIIGSLGRAPREPQSDLHFGGSSKKVQDSRGELLQAFPLVLRELKDSRNIPQGIKG